MDFLRRFLAALTHSGPGYEPPFRPTRGDAFEAWLKTQRDQLTDGYGYPSPDWHALDVALNSYRRHADTGTPLDQVIDAEVPF